MGIHMLLSMLKSWMVVYIS